MKKIIFSFTLIILLLTGCTSATPQEERRPMTASEKSALVVNTIVATALANNGYDWIGGGIGYGEGFGKSKSHTDTYSNTTTSFENGVKRTHTTTTSTTKTKSSGVGFGFGF